VINRLFFSRKRPLSISRIALALGALGLLVVANVITSTAPALAVAPSAGINNKVNYQGRLLNAAGAVLADGNYNMQFKIYKNGDGLVAADANCTSLPDCQSTAGTLLWTEEWLNQASNGVTVKNGYFSVNLGSITTLVGIDLNQPVLWLSMNVAGGANATSVSCTPFSGCTGDGEMLPMKRISSAVYAVNAGSANTCTSCILQAPTSTAQNTIAPATSAVVGLTVNGTTSGTAATAISVGQTLNAANITTTNTGATSASLLSVSQSTSAYTGTAILVNVAAGSGTFASGAFLDLQANSVSKFKIDNLGAVTLAGGQTADITTLAGTAPTALVFQPGSSSTAASTGAAFTLQAGNDTGTGASTGGLLTLKGGNSVSAGTNGGVTIDAGSGATAANGTINMGTANAATIQIASSALASGTQTINIGNSNTAGGTQNVTIGTGSSATAGATTVRAKGALTLTGGAASTWDIGANTLSLQTTGNGAITTGTGLLTQGGSMTFSGTTARTITGPTTGGLTINDTGGALTVSTTTSGTLAVSSAGALNLTGAAASTLNVGANTLTVTSGGSSSWANTSGNLSITTATSGNIMVDAFGTLALNGSNFDLATTGVLTLAGGQTADITTLAGTAPTAMVFQPGNNTTATSTGAALTLQAGNDSGATAATGGLLTLKGGNATGGGQTGGGVTIDGGTGTTGGSINIGTANAAALIVGNASNILNTFNDESAGYFNGVAGGIGNYANLILRSEQFENASWVYSSVTTPTANTIVAPDGNTLAESLVATGSGGSVAQTSGTAPTNANYTFSVWLKAPSGTQAVDLRIDGATTGTGTANRITATTSWKRYSVTQNTNGFTGNIKVLIFPGTTASTGTIHAWGAQLALASTPQVYVRSVDVAVAANDGIISNGSLMVQPAVNSATAFQVVSSTNVGILTVDTTIPKITLNAAASLLYNPTANSSDGTATFGCTGSSCWTNSINGVIGFAGTGTQNGQIAFSPGSGFYLCDSSASNAGGNYGQCASRVGLYAAGLNANAASSITAASTTALQVLNGSSKQILTVDTSGGQVLLGHANTGGVNGKLTFNNSTNTNTVSVQTGTTSAGYTLTLPTAVGATNDCLKATNGTGTLGFASCPGTLQTIYDNSGSSQPKILLTNALGGINIQDGTTPVSGNIFGIQNNGATATYLGVTSSAVTLQDSSGNNAFVFDSTTSHLKVYENITTPVRYADIYYDNTNSQAVFAASSGTTTVGNGAGNVTIPLTGQNDVFAYTKTYTPAATYSNTDFSITRTLTAAANTASGVVVSIQDTSSGSVVQPTLLQINQNNGSATGNLIQGQLAGADKFVVGVAGSVTIASGQSYTGAGAVTLDSATTSALNVGTGANAKTVTIGNITSTTSVVINGGTGGINLGDNAVAMTINIGGVTNSGTDTVNIATNATAADTITVGNTNAATVITLNGGASTTTSGTAGVIIGSATTDTTQINLQLDSFSTFVDTGTCSATVNQGALYYNTASTSIRTCQDSSWSDVITTKDSGLIMFGVVPDSGTNAGDLAGIVGTGSGPCRVYMGNATNKISWTGCVAYSGGRRVVVAAGSNIATSANTANNWSHLCLNGTSNQPSLSAVNASETSTLPTWSATAPILCLADIKNNSGGTAIGFIFDTRTYTTTTKQIVNVVTTAPALGMMVKNAGTIGQYTPTTAAGNQIQGVVVASANTTTANTMNAIIATGGPVSVKVLTTGTVNQYVIASGTAGYTTTSATINGTAYANAGLAITTNSTTCSANNDDCRGSVLLNFLPR
jgi:fibronectin-binding autotransporter adhesin